MHIQGEPSKHTVVIRCNGIHTIERGEPSTYVLVVTYRASTGTVQDIQSSVPRIMHKYAVVASQSRPSLPEPEGEEESRRGSVQTTESSFLSCSSSLASRKRLARYFS